MTPLTPTDWKMIFDGETVSLLPSVGNWQLACRSHYVIRRGQIIRAGDWTERQVAAAQARGRTAKARYYGAVQRPEHGSSSSLAAGRAEMLTEAPSALSPPKCSE